MKKLHAQELSRNQSILRFDFILQHNWPIEQYPFHIRIFLAGKTRSPCFDLFIHWLIKQITNTYQNQFSRSYENRSNLLKHSWKNCIHTQERLKTRHNAKFEKFEVGMGVVNRGKQSVLRGIRK